MPNLFYHVSDAFAIHVLAFIGGFVDSAGYLKLLGLFTSSITGNLVVATASVSTLKGVFCRILVSISFFGAGGLGTYIFTTLKAKLSPSLVSVLFITIELIGMAVVWGLGLYLNDSIDFATSVDDSSIVLIGCLLAATCGWQCVLVKESFVNPPPTTVMTNTLINVASFLVNSILAYAELQSQKTVILATVTSGANYSIAATTESVQDSNSSSDPEVKVSAEQEKLNNLQKKFDDLFGKFVTSVLPLIYFLIGAVIGAITMEKGHFWCMSIPCFLLLFLIVEFCFKEGNTA